MVKQRRQEPESHPIFRPKSIRHLQKRHDRLALKATAPATLSGELHEFLSLGRNLCAVFPKGLSVFFNHGQRPLFSVCSVFSILGDRRCFIPQSLARRGLNRGIRPHGVGNLIGERMGHGHGSACQAVSQFLKSGDPRVSTLRRFAKAIGVDPGDLLK